MSLALCLRVPVKGTQGFISHISPLQTELKFVLENNICSLLFTQYILHREPPSVFTVSGLVICLFSLYNPLLPPVMMYFYSPHCCTLSIVHLSI